LHTVHTAYIVRELYPLVMFVASNFLGEGPASGPGASLYYKISE